MLARSCPTCLLRMMPGAPGYEKSATGSLAQMEPPRAQSIDPSSGVHILLLASTADIDSRNGAVPGLHRKLPGKGTTTAARRWQER
jgi:hypothetical protein